MVKTVLEKGRDIITKEQKNILSASATMMVIMVLTKLVGLVTKTVAVAQLGADDYGLFVAANTLPDMLAMIFLFGSVTSVVIPILVDVIQKNGKGTFSKLFSSIVNVGLLFFVLFALLVVVFADSVTPFVMENIARPIEPYSSDQIAQIVSMMRWLMVPQVVLGISSFMSSGLNAYKRFIVPQLAPFFYNIGVLLGAIFIIPLTGGKAWGLTWGMLIGSVMHLLVQIPLSRKLHIKYYPLIDFKNKKLRSVMKVSLPRILTLAIDQIAIAIDKVIAMGLGNNLAPLGAYDLAVKLVTIPYSLFATSFSVAALPQLSIEYARKNMKAFRKIFSQVFNQILFLSIPVTVILLVLRLPLVRLFYGLLGREFSWENTLMVSWVVFFFSVGLVPEVLYAYLNRAFYAVHDTIRPLLVGIFVVIGGIASGILLTNYFSHIDDFSVRNITWDPSYFFSKGEGVAAVGGLAVSSSIVYTTAFSLLLFLLLKKIGKMKWEKFWLVIIKKIFFGLVMGLFMYVLFKLWEEVQDTARTINVFILTASTIVPGLSVYLWFAYVFNDPEIEIVQKLGKKLNSFF